MILRILEKNRPGTPAAVDPESPPGQLSAEGNTNARQEAAKMFLRKETHSREKLVPGWASQAGAQMPRSAAGTKNLFIMKFI